MLKIDFTIEGDLKDLRSLDNLVKSEDNDFDFNRIIKAPDINSFTNSGDFDYWLTEYWGTCSNSFMATTHIDNVEEIYRGEFETEGEFPLAIFKTLSKKYPDCLITVIETNMYGQKIETIFKEGKLDDRHALESTDKDFSIETEEDEDLKILNDILNDKEFFMHFGYEDDEDEEAINQDIKPKTK